MENKQEKLFNNIVNLKYKIQSLASFVQNDFARMIDDGTTNQEELFNSLSDLNGAYDIVIDDLNNYRKQSEELINHYINHYIKGDLTNQLISQISEDYSALLSEEDKSDIGLLKKFIDWQTDYCFVDWKEFNENWKYCFECKSYSDSIICYCYTR